jgi:hypothetical protein
MTKPLTPSEQLTHSLCTSSFLSLWCYNNPRGKKAKELCDVLVVCDPDVVIFSVKDIALAEPEDPHHVDRWRRRAIDESIKQLNGAARWLQQARRVVKADGSDGVALPPLAKRRTHRIAVACGSRASLSISSGFENGEFVHVFTEYDLITVLEELDTITDFVGYLTAKEKFVGGGAAVLSEGTERDLLALFLSHVRSFPDGPDMLVVGDGCWAALEEDATFIARKEADAGSYDWDDLIETFADDRGHEASEHGLPPTQREQLIRQMAREDRFCRRALAEAMREFFVASKTSNTRSRIMRSPSLTSPRNLYVLVRYRKEEERTRRTAELYARCLIALIRFGDPPDHVLGIGFGELNPGIGSENDLLLVDVSELDPTKWRQEAKELESEWGFFKGSQVRLVPGQEFPSA